MAVTKAPSLKLQPKKTAPVQEVVETEAVAEQETAVAEAVDTTSAVKVTEAAPTDLIEEVAHQIENLKEDKAFKMVPALLNNIDADFFKLGGVLAVIQSQGWFLSHGYETLRAYVEAETDIGYRKAIYLIGIYNSLVNSGVKWEQVKHLGWTKLKELSTFLTPENVAEWVAAAESMTVLQLQEYIKTQTAAATQGAEAPVTEASPTTTTKTFKLHADQKETVNAAIEKAKAEGNTEVDSVALEYICLSYINEGAAVLKQLPTLKQMMEGKSPEEVLEAFAEVFPNINLEATIPD